MAEKGIKLDAMLNNPKYSEPEGVSTLYVVRDGKALGWIGMEDRTRGEARLAMDDLRANGGRRELVLRL